MYTIIGLKRRQGIFNGLPYDNINFYVVDDQNVNGIGECPEIIKVKSSLVPDAYAATSIGRKVEFAYNKYGQVQSVDIIE